VEKDVVVEPTEISDYNSALDEFREKYIENLVSYEEFQTLAILILENYKDRKR
jgi:hypothetical protein